MSLPIEQTMRPSTWMEGFKPSMKGIGPPHRWMETTDTLIIEYDVPILVRDGTTLYANIYLPKSRSDEKLPVVLNYSVYGKDDGVDLELFPPTCGLDKSRFSCNYVFEAADPKWWCDKGFAVAFVDSRGTMNSEGEKSYYTQGDGTDGYDSIEWLAQQAWCNGKVGLYGASAYAMVQWLIAAEKPPSLAIEADHATLEAMIPIDGMTDLYREMTWKGGMKETQFTPLYRFFFNWSNNLIEDCVTDAYSHPFDDEYWESLRPRLSDITVPTYVISSWGDHGIHTRGSINGWNGISSAVKYLEMHQCQKWEWALTEESLHRQKAFFDFFLLGRHNEVLYWPRVRYTMRERLYVGEWRYAETFPIPETQYVELFPTPSKGLSRIARSSASQVSYDALTGEVAFELPVTTSLEFAGHSKLKLWVEALGSDNMDLFITLRKVDASGKEVLFPNMTVVDDGAVAYGWQRVSRRTLDEIRTLPWRPFHTHTKDLLLSPGQVVPVEIEIHPTSCRLRAGERLVLVVSGHDYGEYPPMYPVPRHKETVNKGRHTIHFGGKYDSHLLLPVIPPVRGSAVEHKPPAKLIVGAVRIPGWSEEQFVSAYTGDHANMTRQVASKVPTLLGYTQVVACEESVKRVMGSSWDACTILSWASVRALGASLSHPEYIQTAKDHVFADESKIFGSVCEAAAEVVFDPVRYQNRQDAVQVVRFLPQGSGAPSSEPDDFDRQVERVRQRGETARLLRYVLNRDITPANAGQALFADSPFQSGDWNSTAAVEQYWFASAEDAASFFGPGGGGGAGAGAGGMRVPVVDHILAAPMSSSTTNRLVCQLCNVSFQRAEHLDRHVRSHLGVRPFSCMSCDARDTLQRHLVVHRGHAVSNARPRERVAQACRRCSRAKQRCDGNTPCTRCHERMLSCVYHARPPASPHQTRPLDFDTSEPSPSVHAESALASGPGPNPESDFFSSEALAMLNPPAMSDSFMGDTDYPISDLDFVGHPASILHPSLFLRDIERNWVPLHAETHQPIASATSPGPSTSSEPISPVIAVTGPSPIEAQDADFLLHLQRQVEVRHGSLPTGNSWDPEDYRHVPRLGKATYESLGHLFKEAQAASYVKLTLDNFPSLDAINAFIQLYFEYFHPTLPLLHRPSFNPNSSHSLLVLAVAVTGCRFSSLSQPKNFVNSMQDLLRHAIHIVHERIQTTASDLYFAQALLLNQVGMQYANDFKLVERGYPGNTQLAMQCRSLIAHHRAPASYSQQMLFFDVMPAMSQDCLSVPLPCDERIWETSSEMDWLALYNDAPSRTYLRSELSQLYRKEPLQSGLGEFNRLLLVLGVYRDFVGLRYSNPYISLTHATGQRQNPALTPMSADEANTHVDTILNILNINESTTNLTLVVKHHVQLVKIHTRVSLRDLYAFCGWRLSDIEMKTTCYSLQKSLHKDFERNQELRKAVFAAAVLFESMRKDRCLTCQGPLMLLAAALTLWLYCDLGSIKVNEENMPTLFLGQDGESQLGKQWIADPSCARPFLSSVGSLHSASSGRCVIHESARILFSWHSSPLAHDIALINLLSLYRKSVLEERA
ncbi:hypothetical protein IQ07DRAFT_596165 [Pyrenochaeta sp. DS3sAY3a]|nr:hypothetical protein IQ07DRAFT_596165 [Pyrenochaeta sp. DS3sAY3a]